MYGLGANNLQFQKPCNTLSKQIRIEPYGCPKNTSPEVLFIIMFTEFPT